MRTPVAMSVGLAVTLFSFSALMIVSDEVQAAEYSGTSPMFAPDTAWSLYVGFFGIGDIIEWYWQSPDTLSFSLIYTVDDTTTQIWGFSNDDGYVVQSAGHYGLWWYNNNWYFSACVSYWVAGFTPFTAVASPSEGAFLDSATVTVEGLTDPYSGQVYVGPDAFHLTGAVWSGDNWAVEGVVLSEGQNTILVRTLYWLDYYGYKTVTYDQILSVTVDTIAPELVIVYPTASSYVNGELEVVWQCSDLSGVTKTELKFDAWGWKEVTGTSYQTTLADGVHSIQVRVTDPAGNEAVQATTFTADSTPPELTIYEPTEGSTTPYNRLSFGGSDNIGVMECSFNIDGSGWTPALDGTVYDLDLTNGDHAIQVRLVDRALNEVVRSVNFTLDTELPTVSVTGPADGGDIRGGYVDVTWQCSDNTGIAMIEMKIDGWNWHTVSGYEVPDVWLPSGFHVIQIRVTDNAGNQAVDSTGFNNDNRALSFGGPYYGLPVIGIALAVAVVAAILFMRLRKKKGGPTVATVPPPEEPALQAP